jgi:hypothetical protein
VQLTACSDVREWKYRVARDHRAYLHITCSHLNFSEWVTWSKLKFASIQGSIPWDAVDFVAILDAGKAVVAGQA